MSCAQVMYQPYGGYLDYNRTGVGRMQDDKAQNYALHSHGSEIEPSSYIRTLDTSVPTTPQVTATPVPSGGSTSSSCATPAVPNSPKGEERSHPVIQVASPGHLYERKKDDSDNCEDDSDERKEMRYLSANCILFTSYVGDSSTVVEQHFSRALSQINYETKGVISKVSSPMAQRNFPPSFWNGNYQPTSRNASNYSLAAHSSHDFYNSMAEAYHHSLHPQLGQDPWSHYQLSSQAYFAASAYGGVANNRFAPQYGSLLLHQPGPSTSRLGSVPSSSHCPTVKTEPWNTRYTDSVTGSELVADHSGAAYPGAAHTYSGVTALEGSSSLQDYPKDLYWF